MNRPKIKCVVWDLDHTVWNGVVLEGDELELKPGVVEAMETFDRRGILQSIASRSEPGVANEQLRRFSIDHLFLHPQIGWTSKSEAIREIARRLNIGIDTFAFIDDQAFERDEVLFSIPEVRVYEASMVPELAAMPEFCPAVITEDTKIRRRLYQDDIKRQEDEKEFSGTNEAFLKTLGIELFLEPTEQVDLRRVEELVARTNQLNTTGRVFSYQELERLRVCPTHRLLVAELKDKYGSYGKIGVVLLKCEEGVWTIRLLLMSCRVMNRGVGGAVITWLRNEAKAAGVKLMGEFRATEKNRMMYVTYRFAGFSEVGERDGTTLMEADLQNIPELPKYLAMQASMGEVNYA